MCFLLFAEGFGYRWLCLNEPSLNTEFSDSPENPALKFFVTAMIIFGIGCVNYAGTMGLAPKYPPRYIDF